MVGRRASRLAPPRPVVRFRCAYTEGADPFFTTVITPAKFARAFPGRREWRAATDDDIAPYRNETA